MSFDIMSLDGSGNIATVQSITHSANQLNDTTNVNEDVDGKILYIDNVSGTTGGKGYGITLKFNV